MSTDRISFRLELIMTVRRRAKSSTYIYIYIYIHKLPTILLEHVLMNKKKIFITRQDYQSFCRGADESNQETGMEMGGVDTDKDVTYMYK